MTTEPGHEGGYARPIDREKARELAEGALRTQRPDWLSLGPDEQARLVEEVTDELHLQENVRAYGAWTQQQIEDAKPTGTRVVSPETGDAPIEGEVVDDKKG